MLDGPGARLTAWRDGLPSFAADAVAASDLTQPHIYTQLRAAPDQAAIARRRITSWTRAIGLPELMVQDITLAGDEALSNAVEHAYRGADGMVILFAALTPMGTAARLIVSDRGHWQPPAADPGFRGRGLAMMEQLSDEFRLIHTTSGTTVVLRWSLPAGRT
ncbi:ATP-binding protein [Kibdelosporangium phytohabitans]|uniref:Histidine kinase/HSP90-like ATPase domain-containing protein n=1 Tax=Kibdelosporangium phytohabitans TaxID=860235 RepID=A0A0N7F2W7_9PSEU|nr:ATP-binding protein [Kibdelosporangium phytohabitans]ALG06983.1 hypothetical protein AOZ06_08640 [Kibdelosporangium phytohabitans]MBE1468267.1 anti-sigma regulatory factor (Ser/Thr protein kinase) [Kibdelosporangium phytohabitans]